MATFLLIDDVKTLANASDVGVPDFVWLEIGDEVWAWKDGDWQMRVATGCGGWVEHLWGWEVTGPETRMENTKNGWSKDRNTAMRAAEAEKSLHMFDAEQQLLVAIKSVKQTMNLCGDCRTVLTKAEDILRKAKP